MSWSHSNFYIKMDLKKLLETIQENLAFNLDSYYNQAKELIGTEKQHNLGFLKEDLKKQIETYLKHIVKNITFYIKKSKSNFEISRKYTITTLGVNITPNIINNILEYLQEAIKNGE